MTEGRTLASLGPYNAATNWTFLTKQWQSFDKRRSCNWRVERGVITLRYKRLSMLRSNMECFSLWRIWRNFNLFFEHHASFLRHSFLVCLTTPSVAQAARYKMERCEEQYMVNSERRRRKMLWLNLGYFPSFVGNDWGKPWNAAHGGVLNA
jgi:hypothetical protein